MASEWTLLREVDSRTTLDGMKDGEVGLVRKPDGIEVFVKCSHRKDAACTACMLPALDGILRLRRDVEALKASRDHWRELALKEASLTGRLRSRLARVLRWASDVSDFDRAGTSWLTPSGVEMENEPRGRVWSRRVPGGRRTGGEP